MVEMKKERSLKYTGQIRPNPGERDPQSGQLLYPYLPNPDLLEAVNLAIYLHRPLLLKGEPGCGKTQLARAVAYELGLDFNAWYVKSTSRAQDGLYLYDAVGRLRDAQLAASDRLTSEQIQRADDPATYIQLGGVGKAFRSLKTTVVLIDEIDKADIDFPNDLLFELEQLAFEVKETQQLLQAVAPPIVFITSNNEKDLPDAFLRRCLFHYIEFPAPERLVDIINFHFPEEPQDLVNKAVTRFWELREKMQRDKGESGKKVSTSELIDWFRVLSQYAQDDEVLSQLNHKIPFASVLLKSWDDHNAYIPQSALASQSYMDNPPLLELFTRLREAGFPLGIDDYQAVLEALQAGFGISDRAALARLCRTIWVKSEEDGRLFDYHFDRSIVPETKPSAPSMSPLNLISVAQQLPSDDESIEPFNPLQAFITLSIYALSVGIVVVPYILFSLMGRANHYPVFTSQPVTEALRSKPYEYQIKAKDEDVDLGDRITIKAWIKLNGQKYPITEEGIKTDKSGQKLLDNQIWLKFDNLTWLRFKEYDNRTAILFGTVEQAESSKGRKGSTHSHQIELQVEDLHGGSDLQTFNLRVSNEPSKGRAFPVLGMLLIYAGLPIILYVIYRRSQTSASPSSSYLPTYDPPVETEPMSSSKSLLDATDETRVTSPAPQFPQKLPIISRHPFRQTTEYFPLTRRQMKQSWRFLRRMVRTGTPTELDIEATLNQVSRQGVLLEPVLVPRRVNQSNLLLLIDREGSMVPFHGFSERLAKTAVRGGRLTDTKVYYFHNCPIDYVYGNCNFHQAKTIDEILNNVQSSYTGVLICSDAGAARGTLNAERLEFTTTFLMTLKRRVRYIAWLNPVPPSYWIGTTANQIARFVPMFELNRRGLDNAISVLRGRYK